MKHSTTSALSIRFGRVCLPKGFGLILLLAACTTSTGQPNDTVPNRSKESAEKLSSWTGMIDGVFGGIFKSSSDNDAQELPIKIDDNQRNLDEHVETQRADGVHLARTSYYTPPPPPPPPTPTALDCVDAEIFFEELPDGTILEPAEYISDQYEPFYGLTFSSSGPGAVGNYPRLFDTANPGDDDATPGCGDKDLGAPNRDCQGGGPGEGSGGAPGDDGSNPFQNCEPLGNVLIIQENNQCPEIPDDNEQGGEITLDFNPMAEFVYDIGLLDMDYAVSITIVYKNDRGVTREKRVSVPLSGDNSLQKFVLDQKNVLQLRLNLRRSGAVTSFKFCYNPPETPTRSPSPPTRMPSPPTRMPSPQTIPTRSPSPPTRMPSPPTRMPSPPTIPTRSPSPPTRMPSPPTRMPSPPTIPTRSPSPPTRMPSPPTRMPSSPTIPTRSPSPPTRMPSPPTKEPSPPTIPTRSPSPPTRMPSPPTKTPSPPTGRPTPSPTPGTMTKQPTRNPPSPTPPTFGCEKPYMDWVACVERRRACRRRCNTAVPEDLSLEEFLTSGEACEDFLDWYIDNVGCCKSCSDELEDFVECKNCEEFPPTAEPSFEPPPPTPRPTPRSVPTPQPTPPPFQPIPVPTCPTGGKSKGKGKGSKSKNGDCGSKGGKCDGKITTLLLFWRGTEDIQISGQTNDAPNGIVSPGDLVTISALSGSNDQVLDIIFLSSGVRGTSVFHISCSDEDMNDPSDCGKAQGNGKKDKNSGSVNDWELAGLNTDEGDGFVCPSVGDRRKRMLNGDYDPLSPNLLKKLPSWSLSEKSTKNKKNSLRDRQTH